MYETMICWSVAEESGKPVPQPKGARLMYAHKMDEVSSMMKSMRNVFVLLNLPLLAGCTNPNTIFWGLAAGVVVGIAWEVMKWISNKKLKARVEDAEQAVKKTMVSIRKGNDKHGNISTLMCVLGGGGIAVDTQTKRIGIVAVSGSFAHTKMFSYRDVLSSEIIEDGESVTKTVRSSQVGGALIGGLVLGGVGAIVGGLSGATKSTKKIYEIDLLVTVNDVKNPVHYVTVLHGSDGYKKSDLDYQEAMSRARVWHGKIQALIHQADEDDKIQEHQDVKNAVAVAPRASLADELERLGELRDKGILTEEEFNSQKAKLLAG